MYGYRARSEASISRAFSYSLIIQRQWMNSGRLSTHHTTYVTTSWLARDILKRVPTFSLCSHEPTSLTEWIDLWVRACVVAGSPTTCGASDHLWQYFFGFRWTANPATYCNKVVEPCFFSSSGLCLSCGGGSGCVGGSYQNLKAACVLVCWSRIEQSQCVSVTGSSDHWSPSFYLINLHF